MAHRLLASTVACVLLVIASFVIAPAAARADEAVDRRMADLERRVDHLSRPVQVGADHGVVLFLFGTFCALGTEHEQECVAVVFSRPLLQRRDRRGAAGEKLRGPEAEVARRGRGIGFMSGLAASGQHADGCR